MTKICPTELKFLGFVVLSKLCVSSLSSFIYLQHTLKPAVCRLACKQRRANRDKPDGTQLNESNFSIQSIL